MSEISTHKCDICGKETVGDLWPPDGWYVIRLGAPEEDESFWAVGQEVCDSCAESVRFKAVLGLLKSKRKE